MTTFLQELAHKLLHRHGDDLSDFVVIFPSLRARAFFCDALQECATTPIWQPSWSSIDELMEQGLGLIRGERIRLITELFVIYKRHHPAEEFDKFYFWGDMLISDFDMIDKYLLDASQLLRNIEDIKEIEADVSYLTEAQERIIRFWSSVYSDRSISQQKEQFLKVWRSLPSIYNEYREHLMSLGIGYPGMIYRATAERIQRGEELPLPNKRFIIAGFNALSKSEQVLFDYISHATRGAEFYWDYDNYYVNNSWHEAGMFLRDNIKRFPTPEEISHNNFTEVEKSITSVACVSNIVQIKHIADIIEQLPREELDKRTAIVLTNENLLIPLLHSLPECVDKVNVTMGYPLRTTLAHAFVERLISLQAHIRGEGNNRLFYHKDVTGILSHPYITNCEQDIAVELINEINSKRLIYVEASLLHKSDLLTHIFSFADGWLQLSDYIVEILKSLAWLIADSSREQCEYLTITYEEITRTARSMLQCEITPSVDIFVSLLRRHLQSLTIPFEGEPLEGIQIMGILETRNIDFKNVIILSMTDANFPGDRTEQPSFIPYSLRLAYGLPTPEEHEAMYAYYFYRLIQRAERVDMLYCSRADDRSTGERSRYIYQLEYESPYNISKRNIGVDLGMEVVTPIIIEKGDYELEMLSRYLDPESRSALSPTALFRYIECPLKFYFASIARIKSRDELSDTIDALTFGNILHNAMEILYKPLFNKKNPMESISKLCKRSIVEEAVNRSIALVIHNREKLVANDITGDMLLVRDIIVRYILQGILPYDISREGFTITGIERDVDFRYAISNERYVNLAGRADRIDTLPNGACQIIDYKSGNKPHLEFNGISTLFDGEPQERISNIFQTLLYAMMLHHRDNVEVTPSLYYASKMLLKGYDAHIADKSDDGKVVERYSDVAEEFEERLRMTLEEIFDPETPFKQVDDEAACTYCDYKKICRR